MSYAEKTKVSVERSRAEIEKFVRQHGADQFGTVSDDASGREMIQFRAYGRIVRFVLEMPDPEDIEFCETAGGRKRSPADRKTACDQRCRALWRLLGLTIKAKLEAVASGVLEFEEEFLSQIVMPGDKTVGEYVRPAIEQAYETGKAPRDLLGLPSPSKK